MSFTWECNWKTVEESEKFYINKYLLEPPKPWEYEEVQKYFLSKDGQSVTILHNKEEFKITLTGKDVPNGGHRIYFLCPVCGWRYSILYWDTRSESIMCRKCARLIYRSQKERIFESPWWLDYDKAFN